MRHLLSTITLAILTTAIYGQQTEIRYLSGPDAANPVLWHFMVDGGRRAGVWSTLPVPSCWELHGFGTYNYGKDKVKASETGHYRTRFFVPARWQGQRIYLVFGGVMTDTRAFVNGRAAGPVHQGGFYQFEYDITPLVHYGDSNDLAVTVHKMSANASVNEAERHSDFWVFGGIYRPVWLKAVPPEHIAWTSLDGRADGSLRAAVHTPHMKKRYTVRGQVLTLAGTPVGDPFEAPLRKGDTVALLHTQVTGIHPWSAEDPVLYYVDLSLLRDGKVIHTVRERTGFRTFEVREGEGLFLNGRRIVLKGCDRHSFRPASGRALSRKDCYDDVMLLKAMNMNAVRMSHYPPDPWFLDYCDQYGIYVLDELAGWQKPPYDTTVGRKLVREMLVRDVNHPSILFWDNGNEGGWNTGLDREFARYDLQRRRVLHPWALFNGIDTDHYEGYESVKNKLKSGHIFMPTEHLHGLYDGGSGAGLDDFWNLMWGNPLTGGMFLWVFADEGVVRTDKACTIDVDGNHAPDGILGPNHEKEGSFFTVKEIWSPVYLETGDPLPAGFDGTLPVENRYAFTNLRQCTFSWQLQRLPLPGQPAGAGTLLAEGTQSGPDLPPGEKGSLQLSLPPQALAQADLLRLTACDPGGRELFTWSWKLTNNRHTLQTFLNTTGPMPQLEENIGDITVTSGAFTFRFDKRYGTLLQVRSGNHVIPFGEGPFVVPVSKKEPRILPVTQATVTDSSVVVTTRHHPFFRQLQWTVLPGGWLRLDYAFPYEGKVDYLGISFRYPEIRMQGMRWLGKGPYRVWKDRLKGATPGVWENRYNSFAPATAWNYPEFPGYYANFSWVVFDTSDGPITLATPDEGLFLRVYSQPEGYEPRHARMIWPAGDISILQAIPPIGTKFHDATDLGPQGQKTHASGVYRGTLYFYFGDLTSSRAAGWR